MNTEYYRQYSPALDRDMEVKLYGHAGRPALFIPCQDGRFYDFENFHMADVWAPRIEAGEVMVFAIDTIDKETWSNPFGDPAHRSWLYEQWINFICEELHPFMRSEANARNGWEGYPGVLVYGASLGAAHAANLYFKRPDLFDRLLALSGIYTAEYGFGDYMDELLYFNSPVHYLAGMAPGHPYIEHYNRNRGVICVGQGPWENVWETRRLDDICRQKGINVWVDYWGYDVAHDWPWWYKEVEYFLPYLLDDWAGHA